mmetsp:Transcript_100055/g.261428  ORF Transcript_100055/g.261428 Transcript_100055/m.261428 type:complete len:203 (-) Transcript_100055:1258-1866(-)
MGGAGRTAIAACSARSRRRVRQSASFCTPGLGTEPRPKTPTPTAVRSPPRCCAATSWASRRSSSPRVRVRRSAWSTTAPSSFRIAACPWSQRWAATCSRKRARTCCSSLPAFAGLRRPSRRRRHTFIGTRPPARCASSAAPTSGEMLSSSFMVLCRSWRNCVPSASCCRPRCSRTFVRIAVSWRTWHTRAESPSTTGSMAAH